MGTNMPWEIPQRKNIRIKGYDYSQAGCYFITICVQDRHQMLGKVVGANCVRPCLSEYGNITENEISVLSNTYDTVKVVKHIVMPNHIHMIISIVLNEDGRTQFAPTVSRIIKQFKGSITKQIGFSIWQKSFHDHIIRNDEEYQEIWNYIDTNPQKWTEDCYFVPTPKG